MSIMICNSESKTALLGRFEAGSTKSYEQIAHENNLTYFDAGPNGWKAMTEVDSELPYMVIKEFLKRQIEEGKDFILTADPYYALELVDGTGKITSYATEINILIDEGYRIEKRRFLEGVQMSSQYLPIEESLGYKSVKAALLNVFKVNLDDLIMRKGEYENFYFDFSYNNYNMVMYLSMTGKDTQFEAGEGGRFFVSFLNPKYPKESFVKRVFFQSLLTDSELREAVEFAFGKKEETIEITLKILKDYLDSDDAKVLLKQ